MTIAQMCTMCGRPIKDELVRERIDGGEYIFDKRRCVLTFKKLIRVYGSEFLVNFNTSS